MNESFRNDGKKKVIRHLKKEIADKKRKYTREFRKTVLKEVLEKWKVETVMDVCSLFWGVSGRAKNRLAYREILTLASLGKTAREILNKLEGRK